jgi:16S rRNA (guanine966-N2)-methyltransferase
MRIIAGTLGGRRLTAVPGRSTRPTADRVREALFSRLESRYGIEALSRGAGRLLSVEIDRRAARILIANLQACALEGRSEVHVRDVAAVIEVLERRRIRFEGVFVDPPYGMGLAVDALGRLARGGLVAEGGWVVLETSSGEDLPERFGRLRRVREDLYGDTKLALYELSEEEETVDD